VKKILIKTDGCPGDNKNRNTVRGFFFPFFFNFFFLRKGVAELATKYDIPTQFWTSIAGHGKDLFDSQGAGIFFSTFNK